MFRPAVIKKSSVADPDPHGYGGYGLIWLSWNRILILNVDLDPGARKLTKINRSKWLCTFISIFYDITFYVPVPKVYFIIFHVQNTTFSDGKV
jgi:hypothetical protein